MQLCLARGVLTYCVMDFALVATDLSNTAIPFPQAMTEEPNADWILNWLEAAPVVQAPVAFDAPPRLANIVLGASSTQIYDMAFEKETPPPPDWEVEAEEAVVVNIEEPVVELLSREEHEVDPVDEETDKASECVTTPAAIATVSWTSSMSPALNDEDRPRPQRGLDAPRLRPATEPTERKVMQSPADKGELIWEADLVVAASEVDRATYVSPNEVDQRPEVADTPAIQGETARHQPDSSDSPSHREKAPDDLREASPPEAKRKQAVQASGKREEAGYSEPEPRIVKRVQAVEKRESSLGFPAPKPEPTEVPAEARIERGEGPALVDEVAPARPIRPAQIARVQVDVGAVGQAPGGDPAMRLVLTQRGENVSVHVRSWNDTAVPLTAREVQPLLENLAKQGLAPASETVVESALLVEAPKERAMALGQPAASDPDTRGFNGFDERQQRQQEQHRQQQEAVVRRQQRPAAEFDLKSMLDEIQTR